MRGRDRIRRACGLAGMGLVALLISGCGGVPGARVSPGAGASALISRGGWTELRFAQRDSTLRGELLAVSRDSLYVLPVDCPDGGCRMAAVGFRRFVHGSVTMYRPDTAGVNAWTLSGITSTVSHGWFLVFTAPAWMLTGLIAHENTTSEAQLVFTPDDPRYREIAAWARFPQGLPAELRDHVFPRTPWGIHPKTDEEIERQKGPVRLRRHSRRTEAS